MAKFTHLPFEDWLLSEATLSLEENQALREHLQICESCRQLSTALQSVDNQLHKAPTFSPAPGFADRWMARLAADQIRMKRRQTLSILLFSVGGAGLLFVIIGLALLPLIESPLPVLFASLYRLTTLFSTVSSTAEVFTTVVSTLFGIVPVTLWIGILVALASLSALWIVAFQQLTSPRRITL
jgi:hypothetical protein